MSTILKSARLPEELVDKVKAQSVVEKRSFNNMLVVILADWAKKAKKTA